MARPIEKKNTKYLYFSFKDPISKKWENRKCGDFVRGQEAQAQIYIDQFLAGLAATGDKTKAGPITVAEFIEQWLEARSKKPSYGDDCNRLRKHVTPRIGHMHMISVGPTTIDDLIVALKEEAVLAPTTIRQIAGLVSQLFKRALKEDIITKPVVLWERGTLPQAVDKDPTWRAQAIYTRDECVTLLSSPVIPWDRRVLYALKFLAGGMRHSEAAKLRWKQYDATTTPLGKIDLGVTKSGMPREIPVHPALAKILHTWRLTGWEETYGRQPTSNDLVVPTHNMNEKHPGGTTHKPSESQVALLRDLEILGLRVKAGDMGRNRRGHDLRRTFITLARADGANKDTLRLVTHGPVSKDMMDLYTSLPFEAKAVEVAKLKFELPEPDLLQGSCKPTTSNGKRWRKVATPTGKDAIGTGASARSIDFELLALSRRGDLAA